MHTLYLTHLHLQDACNEAYAAHWAEENRIFLTEKARKSQIEALAGLPPGTSDEDCRNALIGVIADAIHDATDIDCTPETQAEAVLGAILDNCLAYPPQADSAARAAE